ncbi:MAG: hypothetical protein PHS41_08835 [Victivallaceae bacterium]|nr:hypothetical protein [Victivallaceae bacterium]
MKQLLFGIFLIACSLLSGAEGIVADWKAAGVEAPKGACGKLEKTGDWNRKNFLSVLSKPCDLLMIGTSTIWNLSTEPKKWMPFKPTGCEVWKSRFVPLKAAAATVSGARLNAILEILVNNKTIAGNPRVIVLHAGENNLGQAQYTATDLSEGVACAVQLLRKQAPESKILIVGFLPFSKKNVFWSKVKAVNSTLAGLADGKQIFFLDFSEKFLLADGRSINFELLPDGTNLSAKGCAVYADNLLPKVQEIFGK